MTYIIDKDSLVVADAYLVYNDEDDTSEGTEEKLGHSFVNAAVSTKTDLFPHVAPTTTPQLYFCLCAGYCSNVHPCYLCDRAVLLVRWG